LHLGLLGHDLLVFQLEPLDLVLDALLPLQLGELILLEELTQFLMFPKI
jgi:hypothetical protein